MQLLVIIRELIVKEIIVAILIVLLLTIDLLWWRNVALIASLGHFRRISNFVEIY